MWGESKTRPEGDGRAYPEVCRIGLKLNADESGTNVADSRKKLASVMKVAGALSPWLML